LGLSGRGEGFERILPIGEWSSLEIAQTPGKQGCGRARQVPQLILDRPARSGVEDCALCLRKPLNEEGLPDPAAAPDETDASLACPRPPLVEALELIPAIDEDRQD
jgi:hypothetical protein